jgi:hypothetical protein
MWIGRLRRWDELELDAWIAGGCQPVPRDISIAQARRQAISDETDVLMRDSPKPDQVP